MINNRSTPPPSSQGLFPPDGHDERTPHENSHTLQIMFSCVEILAQNPLLGWTSVVRHIDHHILQVWSLLVSPSCGTMLSERLTIYMSHKPWHTVTRFVHSESESDVFSVESATSRTTKTKSNFNYQSWASQKRKIKGSITSITILKLWKIT